MEKYIDGIFEIGGKRFEISNVAYPRSSGEDKDACYITLAEGSDCSITPCHKSVLYYTREHFEACIATKSIVLLDE